jgi:hypothetical protein
MAQEQVPPRQRHLGHEHTKRCYWDFLECRWVCRLDEPRVEAVPAPVETVAAQTVPAQTVPVAAVPLAASAPDRQ